MPPNPAEGGGSRLALRVAGQLLRRLVRPPRAPSFGLAEPVSHLLQRQQLLERRWRMLSAAEHRGWSLAAARLREELFRETAHVRDRAAALLSYKPATDLPSLSSLSAELLTTLLGELHQLRDEFPAVHLDLKGHVISVETERIVLAGVELGPFRIELHLDRLSSRPDFSAFGCVALEPHSAAGDEAVTHPHVKGEGLCAGEATAPLGLALRQGRICDAFCLVRAVLQQYNPHSPYVSIDDWDGVRCSDCDRYTDRDDLYYCEHCGHDVCDQCYGGCELCDHSCCNGCLESDTVTGRSCCPDCRHICDACGRIVESEEFFAASGLCPGCHEEAQEESRQDLPPPQEKENEHPEPVLSTPAP